MNITVEARKFNAREELQDYAKKEVARLNKIFDRIVEVHVILEGKLREKEATIKVSVPDQLLLASEKADKFEIAIEAAVDKLQPQLKRYKEKLTGR